MGEFIKKNPHLTSFVTLGLSILMVSAGMAKSYGNLDARVDSIEERTEKVLTIPEFEQFEKRVDEKFKIFEDLLMDLVKKN